MRNLLFSFGLLAFIGAPTPSSATEMMVHSTTTDGSLAIVGAVNSHSTDTRPKKKKAKKKQGKKHGCEAYSS